MPTIFSFGDFEFDGGTGTLTRDGRPIVLGSRAVSVLRTLIERRDECVSNAQLLAAGWPNVQVEEANIRVHVAALRKVLGDHGRFVSNTIGRGYQFIAPVKILETTARLPATAARFRSNMPFAPARLVGRREVVARISSALAPHSVITISGTGGIGKTSVALAVAQEWELDERAEVAFIDLGAVSDPSRVYAAVATPLSIRSASEDVLGAIIGSLQTRNVLLVLDNCEHLIDPIANLAEVLVEATEVRLLTTSREPLRIKNEAVHRLDPLPFPEAGSDLSAAGAMAFPAVELFAQRARSVLQTFEITDTMARDVAEICRRLDGNPLALEFAAARVESFDPKGLAFALDRRFSLLTQGRRTAPSRQMSLKATLDWSYRLLTPDQQSALRQLAVFSGRFNLADAEGVVACGSASALVIDAIAELAAKSMIAVDLGEDEVTYRLLESIRAYALEKLGEAGEADDVRSRHAAHFLKVFQTQDVEWDKAPPSDVLRFYRIAVDDVRTAIHWAFQRVDDETGIRLTAASAPMWFHLSLLYEYQEHLRFALQRLEIRGVPNPLHEMQLQCALAVSLFTSGRLLPEMSAAGERGLLLAEELGEIRHQLRALWALTGSSTLNADYVEALSYAMKFKHAAAQTSDINAIHASYRMMGLQSTLAGRHLDARRFCETALDVGANDLTGQRNTFVYDHMPVARATSSRVLWLLGYPDSALSEADRAVTEVLASGQPASAMFVMAIGAIPVAFWSGDWNTAKDRVATFYAHAVAHDFPRWQSYGKIFEWVLSFAADEADDVPVAAKTWTPSSLHVLELVGSLHPSLVLPEALVPIEVSEERWSAPEMLRAIGEQLAAPGCEQGMAKAEEMFVRSARLAANQGALGWELRSATSLARLLNRQSRHSEALDTLAPVYDRFTQGFESRDLRSARKVMRASHPAAG
ncbi:winged helix-turn-helix domain-containing protein [Tardiphaga sp. P9-11]|uniref:ATP-binding protein n=1 Tax=Tardiphaga sp. P9-11 TaxID=2024614 RepID=UPI0011F3F101|nr:winged helix-turn-helix domain-containing protein [Tardiphaga sp. P9-11]KAA0075908.1 hypothetical protein CIW50_06450 [Tardiphaga sp. P9-11]